MPSPDHLPEERVAELVEGRLTGFAQAEAQRHLATCAECRALVTSMANVVGSEPARSRLASSFPSGDATGPSVARSPSAGPERIGRYIVQKLLGSGAMGRVYAALDPSLDRRVALKLLRPDAAMPDLESRLFREAKAMARMAHPHVVGVYEVGRHGDEVYVAMELVEGGTLREWLARAPRTWTEVLDVYLRAGEGLAEAHSAGIIHRDFKPDNVLIGDDGKTVRVTDFGLARASTAPDLQALAQAETRLASDDDHASFDTPLTQEGALVGTPIYMAPEQHGGPILDARADLYAFCIALYEGLYGERPFSGTNLFALHASKVGDKVRPAPRGTLVPARIRRVLLAGLRADPAERPPSMAALLSALRRAARGPRRTWATALGVAIAFTGLAAYGVEARTRGVSPRAGSSTGASIDAASCSNAACAREHGGAPWICGAKSGTCVPLEDDRCKAYYEPGDLEASDTVWLGALLPTSGPIAQIGKLHAAAVDLGRHELAGATRPFTGPSASLHARRVAVVVCDDGPAEGVMQTATRLVDDVGVPAILGFRSGQEVVDVAGGLLIQRGVVSVATLSPSALVTQIPQRSDLPRMVLRTTVGMGPLATATAAFVHDYFEPLRAPGAGPTRIALVRNDAPGTIAFARNLMSALSFNDKSAVDNGDAYQEIGLAQQGAAEVAAAARRVIDAAPSIVILCTASQGASILAAIDAGWSREAPRPTYLLASDPLEALADTIGTNDPLRRRVLALNASSGSASNAHFVVRFNEAHPDAGVSRTENPGSSYDAFYLLAYAANAAAPGPVDGRALATQFSRLAPGGRQVEVGPTDVFGALSALGGGGAIDLDGATSSLDFDSRTGEVAIDFALTCLATDARGRAKAEGVETGVTYVAATGRVTGQLRCL